MADEVDHRVVGGATFGDLLRRQRRAAGLTQEELAERSGLSVRGIADLERGVRRAPRRDTVALLVRALGGSPQDGETLAAAARRSHIRGDQPATLQQTQLSRPPHNLPAQTTALLGRDADVRAVVELLRRADVRLVTLTGPGGSGKTRLALAVSAELVDEFEDGIWFVRLSRLNDPALVIPTIARTLGIQESGRQPVAMNLSAYLRERSLALVLDNCEHLAAAAADLASLLESSPTLKLLATSRAALRLRGEREYPTPPLASPSAGGASSFARAPERLADYPATALFIERACAILPGFTPTATNAPAIAQICANLDGLPLAIELAATRIKVLPPAALLAQLERGLGILASGHRDLPERQQTLGATLAWSERLLTPAEQVLFRRLAVFSGGATLATVQVVCASPPDGEPLQGDVLDGLSALVDQSLAQQREEYGAPRFGMLRVVREYALTQLEASGEANTLRRAHARAMLDLAERAEPELTGPNAELWLDRLEREHDNLRATLAWACEQSETEIGQRLVATLFRFWLARGYLREGLSWAESMLALEPVAGVDSTRPRALRASGVLALYGGDSETAGVRLQQAIALARQAGDFLTVANALSSLGVMVMGQGDLEQAETLLREGLTLMRELGERRGAVSTLTNLSIIPHLQGNMEQAAAIIDEALALARAVGDRDLVATNLANASKVALRSGEVANAYAMSYEALQLYWALSDPRRCAIGLESLAGAVAMMGDGVRAARLLGAAAELRVAIGAPKTANEVADITWEVADARAAVGESAWEDAYSAGKALSLEEAVTEALGRSIS
jgi:predicted ATPase/transcriptional regulator with XRE-family HTH domain